MIEKLLEEKEKLNNVNKMLEDKVEIAKQGLNAITETGETNIAQKTLDEIDSINEN